jgi:EAL domain-containing protein (putative c-di-GMP-specific phosphodiesterase class I)
MGCDLGQGYWFLRPSSSAQFQHWLTQQHPAT